MSRNIFHINIGIGFGFGFGIGIGLGFGYRYSYGFNNKIKTIFFLEKTNKNISLCFEIITSAKFKKSIFVTILCKQSADSSSMFSHSTSVYLFFNNKNILIQPNEYLFNHMSILNF